MLLSGNHDGDSASRKCIYAVAVCLFLYITDRNQTKSYEKVRKKLGFENDTINDYSALFLQSGTQAIVNAVNLIKQCNYKNVCILKPAYFSVAHTTWLETPTATVTVEKAIVHVTDVSFNYISKDGFEIQLGLPLDLADFIEVSPSNASNKAVTWLSNDTSVATIDANGIVTPISVGETTITVTTVDGGHA